MSSTHGSPYFSSANSVSSSRHTSPSLDTTLFAGTSSLAPPPASYALSRSSSFGSHHSRTSSFTSSVSRPTFAPQTPPQASRHYPVDSLETNMVGASSPAVLPWPSCYLPSHHAQATPTPSGYSFTSPAPLASSHQTYPAPLTGMPGGIMTTAAQAQTMALNAAVGNSTEGLMFGTSNLMGRPIPPSMQYAAVTPPREFCLPPSAFERQM